MLLHLFVVIAAWSWAGLTLAALGLFRLPLVAAVAATIVAGTFVVLRRHRRSVALHRRVATEAAWLMLWSALAAVLFFPPGQYAVDGSDGSVYLNIGAALAHHGTLRFEEPLLELTPGADRIHVFKAVRGLQPVFDLFPGGLQAAKDGALVYPNFFHLYPVWIASADLVGGLENGYAISCLFAALGVIATWSAARALSTVWAANVAAGLLCVNFAQVWFARAASSETMAQYFVMSGLTFAARGLTNRSSAGAACAGVAFGLAACTRIDMLVLVSPILVIGFVIARLRGHWSPVWTAMAVPFGLLTAQAVAHGVLVSGPYTVRVLRLMIAGRDVGLFALAVPIVIVSLSLWLWLAGDGRWRPSRRARQATIGVLASLVLFRLGPAFIVGYLPLLVTPVIPLLAVAGIARALRAERSEAVLIAVGIFALSALVYAESIRDRPEMPQLFRRFVPVVLPLAMLFAAHALDGARRALGRWQAVTLLVPILIGARYVHDIRPVLASHLMSDVHAQVASAAESLTPSSVLVVDASTPSHLGSSLRYQFGRDVIFAQPGPDAARVIGNWAAALERQGRTLVIGIGSEASASSASNLTAEALSSLELSPAGNIVLDLEQMEPTADRLPDTVRRVHRVVELYRARRVAAAGLPVTIEIGDHDGGRRLSGLHAREGMGAAVTRWTNGEGVVLLPQLARAPDRLVMRVAAPRPAGLGPPSLTVAVDGERVGVTPPLDPGFREVVLPLPVSVARRLTEGRSRLVLSTPVFVPRASGESTDERRLGLVVDWIRLEGS